MGKNIAIGILIVVLLGAGGYAVYTSKYSDSASPSATSTPPVVVTPSVPTTPPVTPKADVPVVRTDATVVPSSSTAIVMGTVNPQGAATTYWYEYGETTALDTRTPAQTIGSGMTSLTAPALLTGLRASTLYHFRLSAKNGFGTVNGTTYDFRTTTTPPPTGTAPTTRTNAATDVSRTTANLQGQINPNGSATTYWYEFGTTADLGRTTALQSLGGGNSLNNVPISLSGLEPLTKYYFRLNAQNQYGTINGSILNFTTSGPAAPAAPKAPTVDTVSANNVATSSVTFRGRINPNGAATTYWFEYSSDSLLGSLIGTVTSNQTLSAGTSNVDVSAEVKNLARNTRYFYRVVGRNSVGTVLGDIVEFKTRP